MPRISWKRSELQFLIDNYETMTTDELSQALGGRSRKSINRKLEKLRDEGKIGHRAKETVNRAYRQRGRNNTDEETSGLRRRGRRRGSFSSEAYEYEEV